MKPARTQWSYRKKKEETTLRQELNLPAGKRISPGQARTKL
ncbi:MAG TPA: hypothetical protein VD816_15215 [Ohtaekwangia sp.]|nr:hypothetical protein [Ohtaekwangia sp.]